MTEYVYALHDFTPEHEDEISFKSGERIEIIERDDQYGDGWWQGRNLSGKVGLFPQSYTSANAPMDELQTPTPATLQHLQPLQEENPEDLINPESPLPLPNMLATDTADAMMAATLTDVQEAIEQLAVRRDTVDTDTRSFSFASTQGAETETDDENRDDHDGGGWHKDARKALAERAEKENARKEREEAEANALYDFYPRKSSQAAPPIEVELSDESDADDQEDESVIRNGTHDIHPHHHKYSASTSTATAEPPPSQVALTTPALTTRRSQASLPTPTSPSPPEEITLVDPPTIAAPRPQTPTTATTKAFPSSQPSHLAQIAASLPSPATSSAASGGSDPSGPASVKNNAPSVAYSSNPPASGALPTSTSATTTATESSLTPLPAQPLQPAPALAQLPTESTHPRPRVASPTHVHASEWTVDQVVEWLKSKNIDDATCAKFIEHEITGDVLLELDVSILKEELNITAFGKRMRIANAIVELRRPASFSSEPHVSLNSTGSAAGLATLGNGFVGNGGASGHGTSTVVDGGRSPSLNGNHRLDGMSIVSGENERVNLLKVPKSRPAQLALSSPSDGALHTTALNGPTQSLPEEDGGADDRGAQSEVTPLPGSASSGTFARSRRFLGLSTESGSSHSRKSGDGGSVPGSPALRSDKSPSVEDHSFSKHTKGKRSLDGSAASKGSDRLSFFGATLGKSRKPPPRYSVLETDASAHHVQDRSSRSLSRLYLSTSKKGGRPTTAPGGNGSIGGRQKERDDHKDKDPSVLRKRHISTNSQSSIPPNASVGNGEIGTANDPSPKSSRGKIVLQPGMSVLDQIGVPDHAGWLKKKGEKYNVWKLRYLVLKGPHLYYLRSNTRTETKIKGYINVQGYKIIADENTNPGKYGFKIVHDNEPSHYFSFEEQLPVREWMKALMKATIDRDYSKPVMSSCNIPTIPLTVAQAMNPAPRPPSPSQREATQKALRRENPNQLSSRDARVLMGLPAPENGNPQSNGDRVRLDSFFTLDVEKSKAADQVPIPAQSSSPPARPSRDARGHAERGDLDRVDPASEAELVAWANSILPEQYRIYDITRDLTSGLVLLRLAESIKGKPSEPSISDATFKGDNLDGMFKLFDFLLDNDVKMGSVSINDVKQGRRDKTIQLLKALRAWGEKRKATMRSTGRGVGQAGPWMTMETGTINW
ncbi:hypothetical protein BU17DRAFT_42692 [Hysterangium stoloniferum]|nr:hypothetical protein BU17DRAFT_42692 [Hysterangium stoloniferum]